MDTWHKKLVPSQDPVTGCFWSYWIFCLYEIFVVYAHISSDHDEIWYVGSLAVPEYGTDAILDFEGQEATPKSFLL